MSSPSAFQNWNFLVAEHVTGMNLISSYAFNISRKWQNTIVLLCIYPILFSVNVMWQKTTALGNRSCQVHSLLCDPETNYFSNSKLNFNFYKMKISYLSKYQIFKNISNLYRRVLQLQKVLYKCKILFLG